MELNKSIDCGNKGTICQTPGGCLWHVRQWGHIADKKITELREEVSRLREENKQLRIQARKEFDSYWAIQHTGGCHGKLHGYTLCSSKPGASRSLRNCRDSCEIVRIEIRTTEGNA